MNKNHNRFQRWQSNPDVKKYANRLFLQFAFLSHLPFYYKRDTNSFLTVLLVCCLFSSLHCSSFLSSCLHYHPFILKLACYPFDLLIGVSLPSSFWAPSSVPSDFAFSKLTPFLLLFLPLLFILRVSSFFFLNQPCFCTFPIAPKNALVTRNVTSNFIFQTCCYFIKPLPFPPFAADILILFLLWVLTQPVPKGLYYRGFLKKKNQTE